MTSVGMIVVKSLAAEQRTTTSKMMIVK